MRIADLIPTRKPFLSLEFFPPKERDTWPKFFAEVEKLKALDPLFVSVTYGAGGGTQANTLDIVTRMKNDLGLEPMAHLTCVGASSDGLHGFLKAITEAGIQNVLALRGDPPKNAEGFSFDGQEFQHASDLVEFIGRHYPDMGIGVAGIPTMHPESASERGVIRLALAQSALGKKARHGRARARVTGRITGIELGEEAAPARGHRAAQAGLCRERCGRREQHDEYGAHLR